MADILIYLTTPEARADAESLFQEEPHHVILLEDVEEVVAACQRDIIDLLLIWPADPETTTNMITLLSGHQLNYIPVVPVITAQSAMEDFYPLPVAELIQTPKPRQVFLKMLSNVIQDARGEISTEDEAHWEGSLGEYNLVDLIQMIELNNRDTVLILKYDDEAGVVYFRQGAIVDAKVGELEGLEALKKLAVWQRGHFQVRVASLESHPATIEKENQELLVTLVEYLLKVESLSQGLPRLYETVMTHPLHKPSKPTSLQKRILEACRKPCTIFSLLSTLPDQTEDILLELSLLFQNNAIGRKNEVEAEVRAAEEQSGLDKLITSVSSVFKKKPELPDYVADFSPEAPAEGTLPPLQGVLTPLSPEEINTISEKLETTFQ